MGCGPLASAKLFALEPSLPKGHRDLTFEDMARLTFDENDNLCLDGKPIEVKKMTLTNVKDLKTRLEALEADGS